MVVKKQDVVGVDAMASAVELPLTFLEYIKARREHQTIPSFNYPADLKLICRYSGGAVEADRSCGDVMIMMVGYTGAGKSTTINKLFGDDGICQATTNTSGTKSVCEARVKLTIEQSSFKPSIDTSLVFVDIPGSLDTDEKRRELNQAIVKKYLGTTPRLTSRPTKILNELHGFASSKKSSSQVAKEVLQKLFTVESEFRKVFPNLVLLTVSATDRRMVGSDSNLSKTIKSLKELEVIDMNRLNLLVVVTNAGGLCNEYAENTKRICEDVRKLLVDIFDKQRLNDTPVKFIENEPELYHLERQKDSDFYLLPDGTLSHFNLIQAMTNAFQANGDLLGMLVCGRYFGKKSSDKKGKVDLTEKMTLENLGSKKGDIKSKAQKIATEEAHKIDAIKLKLVRELPLQSLGHGFCPSTEFHKCNLVIKSGKTQPVRFQTAHELYITHSQFKLIKIQEPIFDRLTQDTKKEYEARKVRSYGFEREMNFKMNESVCSFGKWKSESDVLNNGEKFVSFIFERRILCLQIEDPKRHLNADLQAALNNLPTKMSSTEPMNTAYLEFFGEWGTHFVRESYMGGSIKVTAKIPSSMANDPNYDSKIMRKLENIFYQPEILKMNTSKSAFYSKYALKFCGGIPPSITVLSDLTPEIFQEWIKTIEYHPAELDHCIKLAPYYQMIEGPQRIALQLATAKYLKSETTFLPVSRENVSNVICASAMNDQHKDYYYKHPLPVCFLIGIVAFLSAPLWGPFFVAAITCVPSKASSR